MKKINGLVISALTAAFLVGCGGGSSGGGTPAAGTPVTETPVTEGVTNIAYDRGAVYGAKITDKNGKPAIDKGTNVYQFVGTFEYPITAKGGNVDTDGDGLVDETLPETFEYKSYYEVITPITNYLSAFDTEEKRTVQLTKLQEIIGLTPDEMKSKISSTIDSSKKKTFDGLKNTLFKAAIDSDTTNDDITKVEFKNLFDLTKEKTEKEVFNELRADTSAKFNFIEIPKDEAEKIKKELGTASDKLKIADLGRFVSYEGDEDWFDDNTLSGDKITFKPYSYDWNTTTSKAEWILDEGDGYVTVTKDATDPYKLSYVDSITKEEGTFTIISTTKLGNYTDLSKSIAKIEVTKAGTELEWDRWSWTNPYYFTQTGTVQITDIKTLVDGYVSQYSSSIHFNEKSVYLNSDGKVVESVIDGPHYSRGTKEIGTWKQDGEQIVATVGKQTKYLKVVSEDGKYYIEEAELDAVGYIDSEIIYTGTSLDDLIANIKAPAPEFTSNYFVSAAENQTSAYTPTVTDTLKVTYSLTGTDAKYFNIDSATGVVTFKTAPDFESTTHTPYYDFIVKATNSAGKSSNQNVMLNVTNVDEQTTTPTEQTPTTTSFVSGKSITGLFGDNVTFTANFNTDGSYSDTTFNDGSCSGTWNDIGNNTIVTSCGTFSFPSSNLPVGENFTLDGDNSAPESATITSVTTIQ